MRKFLIIGSIATICLISCGKLLCSVQPFTMEINIKDLENKDLLNFSKPYAFKKDSIKLFYFENGIKKYSTILFNEDFQNIDTTRGNIISNIELQDLAVTKNIRSFYLYLNSNTIDTFSIKAHKDGNCTNAHQVDEFKVNKIDFLNQSLGIIVGDKKYYIRII